MLKLVDLKCVACGEVYEDALVDDSKAPAPDPSDLIQCEALDHTGARGERCSEFKVVIGVARHSKHSSWEVR